MADVWAVPVRIHRDSVSEELENTARKIALSFSWYLLFHAPIQ